MATDLENLQTAKSAILTQLAAHAGTPATSGDGRSTNWGSLWDDLKKVNAQIAALEGPWEIETIGI